MSTKRKADKYDKSDAFVASDDETTTTRPSKKARGTASNGSSARKSKVSASNELSSEMRRDDDGNQYWEISKARRVTISDFKGKTMVSIREYYEKDGKQLPGKKGISMTIEQYSAFISLLPQIEKTLVATGQDVSRPQYDGGPVTSNGQDHDSDEADDTNDKKANFEATSDEDED